MRTVVLFQRMDVKTDAVVRNHDLVAALCLPGKDPDDALLADADAVANGVLHDRLYRQRREGKAGVLDRILDADIGEADPLNIRVGPRMLQLFFKAGQPRDLQ